MASNIFSRLLPPATGSPSIYETFRELDQSSDPSDVEDRAGMALDEENLNTHIQDHELDDALLDAAASQRSPVSNRTRLKELPRASPRRSPPNRRWAQPSPRPAEADDLDDEVPESLLIEDGEDAVPPRGKHRHAAIPPIPPIPGPATKGLQGKWQAAQEQQPLHPENRPEPVRGGEHKRRRHTLGMINPKERAMWRWANVENLDNFLKDVYDYFIGNGVWCILLSRLFYLL